MAFAYCPDCARRIYLGRKPWVGQAAFCDHCEADLEVVQLNPPEVDWTDSIVEESWERDRQLELQVA